PLARADGELVEVVDPAEDPEVVRDRRAIVRLAGGDRVPLRLCIPRELLVLAAERHPRRVPLAPRLEPVDRPVVVVHVDPVVDDARLPAADHLLQNRVGHAQPPCHGRPNVSWWTMVSSGPRAGSRTSAAWPSGMTPTRSHARGHSMSTFTF